MSVNEAVRREEERMELSKLRDGMVGKHDEFVIPGRRVVRQGGVHQLGRRWAGGGMGRCPPLLCEGLRGLGGGDWVGGEGREGGRAVHHAILCNDSLWLADVLRGEKYMISHVFRFENPVRPNCTLLDVPGAAPPPLCLPTHTRDLIHQNLEHSTYPRLYLIRSEKT